MTNARRADRWIGPPRLVLFHFRADLICQSVIARGTRSPDFVMLQGRAAVAIGELATARRCFEELLAASPSDPTARSALSDLSRLEGERRALDANESGRSHQRFHLIKAWEYGLTADLDHTLGASYQQNGRA